MLQVPKSGFRAAGVVYRPLSVSLGVGRCFPVDVQRPLLVRLGAGVRGLGVRPSLAVSTVPRRDSPCSQEPLGNQSRVPKWVFGDQGVGNQRCGLDLFFHWFKITLETQMPVSCHRFLEQIMHSRVVVLPAGM